MEKEKLKYQKELEIQKNKLIEELKRTDKEKFFNKSEDKKKKISFFQKLKRIIYG
jgi:hypothetical protein